MSLSWIALFFISASVPVQGEPAFSTVEPGFAKSAPIKPALSPGQAKGFAVLIRRREDPTKLGIAVHPNPGPFSVPLPGNEQPWSAGNAQPTDSAESAEKQLPLAKVVAIVKPMAPPPSSFPMPLPIDLPPKSPAPVAQ
jgi:hypothetical protein